MIEIHQLYLSGFYQIKSYGVLKDLNSDTHFKHKIHQLTKKID